MCGRYVTPDEAAIERAWFKRGAGNPFASLSEQVRENTRRRNYNAVMSQQIPVLRTTASGEFELTSMQWGFIPHFGGGVPSRFTHPNIRIESLKISKAYRKAREKGQRNIMLAVGFYEWQVVGHEGKKAIKQPWYIRMGDQDVCGFAAYWDTSKKDGAEIVTTSMVSMEANETMSRIHNQDHRMPAILAPDDWITWLAGSSDEAEACLRQYPDELMIAHRVSRRVNNTKNNDEALLTPWEEPATT